MSTRPEKTEAFFGQLSEMEAEFMASLEEYPRSDWRYRFPDHLRLITDSPGSMLGSHFNRSLSRMSYNRRVMIADPADMPVTTADQSRTPEEAWIYGLPG